MIYIALFRGLNVGGHHKIKMADLCAFLNRHGGENTKHYIQSGNLVFHHDDSLAALAQKLEPAFADTFGFQSQIVLRTLPQLQAAQKAYPFDREDREQKFMMTGFARATPNDDALELLTSLATEKELVAQQGEAFFFYFGDGSGRSKIANLNFEKKIGTALTIRNRRTISKLIEMAEKI
ncbi:DUF1697 domain-containing protein [Maritalea mediterranea]|uniref:DUF1697 domain-containing protein n=1 Tax=Maritalea mediterranea TaxID=2909667 RepID=A0ABS9E3I7_9HYPH|nr:DUF1697 domain-containing protein [Maritalea mediterranea]MCF4097422.1 DUF1697 domain-containing protein [Maritalea mediterranea]